MRIVSPGIAPLGRLHDPLRNLAARVHRVLGTRCKTVSTDPHGWVFVDKRGIAPTLNRSVVGTYDRDTPLGVIEDDLRVALRERASQWITDWSGQRAILRRGRHGWGSDRPAR